MTDDPLIPAFEGTALVPVPKLAAHHQGLRHMAVSVFLLAGRKMLLQQRAAGKYHTPGLWANACCTHPNWGEAPDACALRRVPEELGLTLDGSALTPRGQVEYRADVGGGMIEHEVVDLFTAEIPPEATLTPNPNEVAATRWIDLADLEAEIAAAPDRFTPWLRIYWAEHRARIVGGRVGDDL